MMRFCLVLLAAISLSACAGKTRLVPQAYMPEPPELLMQEPRDLRTIKDEGDEPETSAL